MIQHHQENNLAATPVDDATILHDIENAIWVHNDLDTSRIEVSVKNRMVKLSGIVESIDDKEHLIKVVKQVKGVSAVSNEIEIERGFFH